MNTAHRTGRRLNGRFIAVSLLSLGLLAATPAHGQTGPGQLVMGESATMFGAKVTTWARLAPDGSVLAAGATLPLALVEAAPAAEKGMPGMSSMGGPPADAKPFALNFPAQVKATTFLDHVDLGWVPGGHPPVYLVPHFDLHFFTISKQAVEAIDCKNLAQSDPALLAPGYVPPVPPNTPPAEVCVPFMGFHSLPAGDLAPGAKFDKTMIAVYYGGQLGAIEPMVTRATLLKKQSFSLPVPALPAVGKATRFPTKFEAVFDKAANAYQLTFSNFVTKPR